MWKLHKFKIIAIPLLLGCVITSVLAQSRSQYSDVTQFSILSDIELFNASCFPKDSCRQDKVSRVSDNPDWEKRNCLCDDLCVRFGDCCPDSKRFEVTQQSAKTNRFSCIQLKQYNFNWIVNKCPEDWTDLEVVTACEGDPAEGQVLLDPIGHMPVTNLASGITYRNINCAVCHRDIPTRVLSSHNQLRFWNPRLECNSILAGNSIINNATSDILFSKVQWNDTLDMWGLMIDVNGKGEQFHSCFIDPSLPDDLQPYLRPCQLSTNECPPSWPDDDISRKCSSYTSFVYRPQEVFQNVHCAICNGVQPGELSCNSTGPLFRNLPPLRDFNPSAFALLFDLKDKDGSGIVGQLKNCDEGQLYDPFSRKCRQVFCSQPGTVFRNGRCLDVPSSTSTPQQSSTPASVNNPIVFPEEPSQTSSPDLTTITTNPNALVTKVSSQFSTDAAITTKSTNNDSVTEVPTDLHPTRTAYLDLANNVSDEDSPKNNFTSCPKFMLSESEIEWRENGTLYVPSRDEVFQLGSYEKETDGSVFICAHGLSTVSKFDPVLGWVTVAGLGLSEICLALHLLAFFLSPNLRNLSGRNLASLSFALFAAYGSFIGAQFVPIGSNLCVGIALSTFYFFLSAFWWTSVMAWDVWHTIRLATVQLRCSSSGQQWGKFILYSLYAWLVPGLIVAATMVIEYVDVASVPIVPEEYHPHFGRTVCWFSQRKAILVYFAAPLTAILCVNLLLFINSAYMIRSTTAKSPTSSNQAGSRKQLGLYVRLALIMGLSWIAGLIAGAADFVPMWYVFVALCSLQGTFILLAYTCNPKVARNLSRIMDCRSTKRRQSTYRTALVSGLKGDHLKRLRLGLEARDSHDSNTSQASQTSQTSLTTSKEQSELNRNVATNNIASISP